MRKTAALSGLTVLLTAGSLVAAANPVSATAEDVSNTRRITYTCTEPPWPGSAQSTYDISLAAPLVVRAGNTINIKASLVSVSPAPAAVPANALIGFLDVVVGGTGSGTVTASGLTNTVAVPAGALVPLTGGHASVTAGGIGAYTFSPGTFQLDTHQNTTIICVPNNGNVVTTVTVIAP